MFRCEITVIIRFNKRRILRKLISSSIQILFNLQLIMEKDYLVIFYGFQGRGFYPLACFKLLYSFIVCGVIGCFPHL